MVIQEFNVIRLEKVISTQTEAQKFVDLEGNNIGKACIVAKTQSGGIGRMSRRWDSPVGNLYCTVILPEFMQTDESGMMSILVGLGLGDMLRQIIGSAHSVELKWPNDIMVDGKKICGILCQRYKGYVLVGIGINIASCPEVSVINRPATYLQHYILHSEEEILDLTLHAIEKETQTYQKFGVGDVIERFNKNAAFIGENIIINTQSGKFIGINRDGNAILRLHNQDIIVTHGDVENAG